MKVEEEDGYCMGAQYPNSGSCAWSWGSSGAGHFLFGMFSKVVCRTRGGGRELGRPEINEGVL